MAEQRQLKKIKSSVLSRGLTLGKIALSTGTQLAGHGISNLLSDTDKKDKNWKAFLTAQAKNITMDFGELKGSVMKAGQMLSMYGDYFLPPEANQFLKTLQSQSPPLEWNKIKNQLLIELGPQKMKLLEFEQTALGSASLGQVHKAVIKETGQVLALKIQYPGVAKAIDSDLKGLRSLLSLLKFVPRGPYMDHVFQEIREMLVQETNYRLEAEETQKYRARLKGDDRYVVPEIFPEFCTDRVIATSYEEGVAADHPDVQNLDRDRRNLLGRNFLELYFKELFGWGIVQTDPHLGNYRVRLNADGNDQLVLLDFGAVRTYSKDFLEPYTRLIHSALHGDRAELSKAAHDLRFLYEDDNPKLRQIFEEFCLMTVEPFLSKEHDFSNPQFLNAANEYDWKKSDLPQRLTKKVFQMVQQFHIRPPPKEVVFLDRKTGGVFVFLAVLRAQINGRPIIDQFLKRG